ncbi:hypothetical protein PsorP6_012702 [Peronosclerospora sorghi]|uniref:Uncharacterized protein n=1 Tax=Peronosclerospora sorghi TaxID=230839 RepID=A0ACC0WGC6_9STRA|nr:hypothetical protein PsorP6_012702 [Peronosclerospora sorghi]
MNAHDDVTAMLILKEGRAGVSQRRSSVGSVDNDSDVRTLPDVELDNRDKKDGPPMGLQPKTTLSDLGKSPPALLSLEEVHQQLKELENAPGPTQDEIEEMIAQYAEPSDVDESVSSDSSDERETVIMKVLVVGNSRCGKTSLIRRFTQGDFTDEYVSTIGADFMEKTIKFDEHLTVSLQLWDIAGQDRFAKFTRGYFREAKGAVIVCDITRTNTINAVMNWKKEIDTCCKDMNTGTAIPVVMVANKCDLLKDPMGAMEYGIMMQKCVDKSNIVNWFRASAKSGEHIHETFDCLVDCMVRNHRAEKAIDKSPEEKNATKKESIPSPEVIRLSKAHPHYRAVKQRNVACDCH